MARSTPRADGVNRTETILVRLAPDEKEHLTEICGLIPLAIQVRQLILDWMEEQDDQG